MASVLPRIAFLAVVVGIVGQGAEALTIEETGEWQACVRNPSGCTRLVLSDRGLTGSIPAAIGDFVNLREVNLRLNKLSGSIPPEIGSCVNLKYLRLYGNQLSGSIPPEIGKCTKLEKLRLQENQLSGSIPPEIGNCVKLEGLYLYNNNLQGAIPDIWEAMTLTLTTLDLHGNKLTGSVPTHLFDMGFYANSPLASLNLGDNLLSGPVPIHYRNDNYGNYKLTDHFSELWLLGNNWDGGPCVALCGGINAGSLDDAKRASTKIWAQKCLEDTDSHKGLADSAYSVDELGRCSFKSQNCSKATYYVERRTIVDPDCKRCPVHTFQPSSSHTETECDVQPTCGAGQFISKDDDDLRTERRSCAACATNTYQSSDEHRLTECIDQPTCAAGQKITGTDGTVDQRRICVPCPPGEYQNISNHRETDCKPQPPCPAGTEFEVTSTAERECTPCGDNEYQDSDDADALQLTCIAQPTCSSGQYITEDSSTVRRVCNACPPGFYQSKAQHRETDCKPQPPCTAGTAFEVTSTEERECTPCGDNEYQDSDDADALQLTCIAQPTCSSGQYITEDSSTVRRVCNACPPGFYQSKAQHRDTTCIKQRTCPAGTEFTTTSTADRACGDCGDNEFQESSDANALQTICIEQTFCAAGQKISEDTKTERRQCSDCPAGQYQDDSEHRSTTCTEQPKCGPGTLFRGSLYAERTCDACPPNTYQPAIDHTETTCIPQQGCLPQQAYVGNSTTKGRCEPCKDGSVQPENNHFDACIDISLPTTVCNDVGELDSGGTCVCNAGFAGPQCEFSNEETCNGFGHVTYNAQANAASCSNCTDPAIAVGDRCQFSNSKTCKDFGTVSGDGTCDWNRNPFDDPIVSECDAGYYYNPNPETPGNEAEDEDAIDVGADNCYPCSPGHFATGTARRVQCDACPTVSVETDDGALRAMLQTSEPASASASDCFAKFQSGAADQQFCYGENVDAKPLSRIKSSDDCSISATSLGLTFAGEFVLPYPGCMYDEEHQEARFYVGQSQYDQALSTASPSSDSNNDDDNNDNDSSRRRRKERQQHQQRRRKQQQPREQDQQPQRRSHQKRRRKLKLVPMKDTPLCELYVCKDPKNEVTALTSNPADAGATPSCRVSVAQIKEAYAAEQAESQSTFMPAAYSLSAAALVGSYVHQYRSASKAGLPFTIWHHKGAWLTSLRVFDMLTDFGFYFISLHGSEAFLEAYSDDPVLNECGQPETNPYEEPKVAAFLYISVFCTALGLFMTPLDIWAMSQRSVGGGMGIVGVAVVLSITLFEDTPQLALASIYIKTMREVDIEPDPVSILSLAASALSMLFNVATVVYYTRKLRMQDPTGWWKGSANMAAAGNAPDQTARIDALEAENAALKQEVAQLKSKKEMKKKKTKKHARSTVTTMANPEVAQLKSKKEMKKKKTKKHARSTVTTMANPVFNVDGNGSRC